MLERCAHWVAVLPIRELGMRMVSAAVSSCRLFVLQQCPPQSHQLFLAALRADVRDGRPQFIEGEHPASRQGNGRGVGAGAADAGDPAAEQESTRRAFACVRAHVCSTRRSLCRVHEKHS